jgi:hypothetical protein
VELGLRQKDVGKLLRVDDFTALNWEKGKTTPETRCLPRIVLFLGYDPFPVPKKFWGNRSSPHAAHLASRAGNLHATYERMRVPSSAGRRIG